MIISPAGGEGGRSVVLATRHLGGSVHLQPHSQSATLQIFPLNFASLLSHQFRDIQKLLHNDLNSELTPPPSLLYF